MGDGGEKVERSLNTLISSFFLQQGSIDNWDKVGKCHFKNNIIILLISWLILHILFLFILKGLKGTKATYDKKKI